MSTEEEFQRQNERFELLLNAVTNITSGLDIREVLRTIAAHTTDEVRNRDVALKVVRKGPGLDSSGARTWNITTEAGRG